MLVLVTNNSKALLCFLQNCLYALDLTFSHKSFFGCTNACIPHKFRNYIISRKHFFNLHIKYVYAYSIHKSLSIYFENPFDRLRCTFAGRFDSWTMVRVSCRISYSTDRFTKLTDYHHY